MMGGLAVYYSWDGKPCTPALMQRMMCSVTSRTDIVNVWTDGGVGLAETRRGAQPVPSAPLLPDIPLHHDAEEVFLVADVRLDDRATLLAALRHDAFDTKIGTNVSDTALIALAYHAWGMDCVQHLRGDFTFALWERRNRCLLLARSVMGIRPCIYACTSRLLLCASDATQLFALAEDELPIRHDLDEGWLATWLTQGAARWDATPYRDLHVLPPGHLLLADTHDIQVVPFWHPPTQREVSSSIGMAQADYSTQFHSLLRDAVRVRMSDRAPMLCDLSGGLDSSSIASLAAQIHIEQGSFSPLHVLHVSSSRFPEADDRAAARLIAQQYGMTQHELSYDDSVFAELEEARSWSSLPCIPTLLFSKLYHQQWQLATELGACGHLRGDFGDQLVGGSFAYLADLWDEHRYLTLWHELRAWQRLHSEAPISLFAHYVLPTLRRRQRAQAEVIRTTPWLRAPLWQRAEQQYRQDDEVLRRCCPHPLPRLLLYWMQRHTASAALLSDGLRAAGLDIREPFSDQRLIEFVMGVPAQYQLRAGQSKFLLREAMRDVLPEPIRQRQDKGRIARLIFRGIAAQQYLLRELVEQMPSNLAPYLNPTPLLHTLDEVAQGAGANQVTLLSALALIVWAHRLPWGEGKLRAASTAP